MRLPAPHLSAAPTLKVLALASLCVSTLPAYSQPYPQRPVRIVVNVTAGGGVDLLRLELVAQGGCFGLALVGKVGQRGNLMPAPPQFGRKVEELRRVILVNQKDLHAMRSPKAAAISARV